MHCNSVRHVREKGGGIKKKVGGEMEVFDLQVHFMSISLILW